MQTPIPRRTTLQHSTAQRICLTPPCLQHARKRQKLGKSKTHEAERVSPPPPQPRKKPKSLVCETLRPTGFAGACCRRSCGFTRRLYRSVEDVSQSLLSFSANAVRFSILATLATGTERYVVFPSSSWLRSVALLCAPLQPQPCLSHGSQKPSPAQHSQRLPNEIPGERTLPLLMLAHLHSTTMIVRHDFSNIRLHYHTEGRCLGRPIEGRSRERKKLVGLPAGSSRVDDAWPTFCSAILSEIILRFCDFTTGSP